jgi:predicted small secreted protein
MKRVMVILMVLATVLLSGCNTWRGFGQDVERVGESIQRSGKR